MYNERNTIQKKKIMEFLKKNINKHITVSEIKEALKNEIGQTTIYRIINNLIMSGEVIKIPLTNEQGFCYQYMPKNEKCMIHYHLICEKCGKLIHFDSKKIADAEQEVLNKANFEIDNSKTVFYGKCKSC